MTSSAAVPGDEGSAALPAFADALDRLRLLLARLDEPWRPHSATEVWISALKASGLRAKHATIPSGKYSRSLPFVIEMTCPFDHRSEDRRDYASVRLIVDDDGWVALDRDSTCPRCDAYMLERYLLTCPRCESGEDSDDHTAEHDSFDWEYGDRSPVSYVLRELRLRFAMARARFWLERFGEAVQWATEEGINPQKRVRTAEGEMSWAAWQVHNARALLGTTARHPSNTVAGRRPTKTVEEAVEWLDSLRQPDGAPLVAAKATQREALQLTADMPDRPAKNVLEKAQTRRATRTT